MPDFNELSTVLDEMVETMAFKRGMLMVFKKLKNLELYVQLNMTLKFKYLEFTMIILLMKIITLYTFNILVQPSYQDMVMNLEDMEATII